MEVEQTLVNTPRTKELKRKKTASSEDQSSDDEPIVTNKVPYRHFLVMQPVDETRPLTALSPFLISKFFKSAVGSVKVTPMRSGSLLIETDRVPYSVLTLAIKEIAGIPVNVTSHKSLNSSRGVVRCRELINVPAEEIIAELTKQGVCDVKKTFFMKDQLKQTSSTHILTFDTPTPPKEIRVGYLQIKVDQYLPNPMRCFRCQRYGHLKTRCNRPAACADCGEPEHEDATQCPNAPHCANCKGAHPAYAKVCPHWLREKQVIKIKMEKNITFPEARKLVENNSQTPTYASKAAATPAPKATTSTQTQTDIVWPIDQVAYSFSPSASAREITPTKQTASAQTNTDSNTPITAKEAAASGAMPKQTTNAPVPNAAPGKPKPSTSSSAPGGNKGTAASQQSTRPTPPGASKQPQPSKGQTPQGATGSGKKSTEYVLEVGNAYASLDDDLMETNDSVTPGSSKGRGGGHRPSPT